MFHRFRRLIIRRHLATATAVVAVSVVASAAFFMRGCDDGEDYPFVTYPPPTMDGYDVSDVALTFTGLDFDTTDIVEMKPVSVEKPEAGISISFEIKGEPAATYTLLKVEVVGADRRVVTGAFAAGTADAPGLPRVCHGNFSGPRRPGKYRLRVLHEDVNDETNAVSFRLICEGDLTVLDGK